MKNHEQVPSREQTYPPKKLHFEDDFPFSKVGYVSSLEGISKHIRISQVVPETNIGWLPPQKNDIYIYIYIFFFFLYEELRANTQPRGISLFWINHVKCWKKSCTIWNVCKTLMKTEKKNVSHIKLCRTVFHQQYNAYYAFTALGIKLKEIKFHGVTHN